MKRIFLINITLSVITSISFLSCSKQTNDIPVISQTYTPPAETSAPVKPVEPAKHSNSSDKGLSLIEGADCLSCHKMDEKLIGPSYKDVAAKYTEADIDMLADKIIEGGKGNWGDIPMTPHAEMSKENAKSMVKYILSLKK